MASKTLINGTAYEIKGGKTLVNGTAYEIKGGKTLVNGTAYDISFVKIVNVTLDLGPTSMNSFMSGLKGSYSITIDDKEYKPSSSITQSNKNIYELQLLTGTIISCQARTYAGSTELSGVKIVVNGETVAEAENPTAFSEGHKTIYYNYKLRGNVHIVLEMIDKYGTFTITEV